MSATQVTVAEMPSNKVMKITVNIDHASGIAVSNSANVKKFFVYDGCTLENATEKYIILNEVPTSLLK